MNKRILSWLVIGIIIGSALSVFAGTQQENNKIKGQEDPPVWADAQYNPSSSSKVLIIPDQNLRVAFFHQEINIPASQSLFKMVLNISNFSMPNSDYTFVPTLEMKESYLKNVNLVGFIRINNETIKLFIENNVGQDVNVTLNGALIGDYQ